MTTNPVLEAMLRRRSIREFSEEDPTREAIEAIVRAGQQAPFAAQHGSLLLRRDREANPFRAPHQFTVCVDEHRMERVMAARGWQRAMCDLSVLLLGIQDVAYMAQNMVQAAEALGLGSCFLGAAPFYAGRIVEEYGLPPRVFPLVQLAMGGATFLVGVDADPSGLGTDGADLVGFRLSANPGEPARPLARVASGGELSRVLLALKEVLQDRGYAGSFVLDEIDSGIGGTTADVVGRKLEALARGRQLIAITHLPQIAARAGSHVVVGKREQEGRTRVWAERLSEEARVDELARMVAGDQHTDRSRALAGEMLQGSSARTGRDGVVE